MLSISDIILSVISTSIAAANSFKCLTDRVPGIGIIFSLLAKSQAIDNVALATPISLEYFLNLSLILMF